MSHQEQETIQFFKIKLMEKDREIADFEAKMKKSQFKHNRQIKEVKIGQQRLQRVVKDEKNKTDKLSNQLRDIQEQHKTLKIKFGQYKEEKDKEIADLYNKYGVLKEQVRSYERILPTFTFLLEIDKSINEIPVYEDLFINLNQKSLELNELNQKFESTKVQWEQVIKNMKLNEQLLKNKKLQAQKSMKEILSKVYEYQQQVYEAKCQNQNLNNIINETNEELQLARQRGQSLQQSLKEYEMKMQSLAENFETLLKNKEDEIHFMNQQQRQQLQQKIQYELSQFEKKENMYTQQINSFQQEITFLNSRYRQELSNFQQHFISLKEQTELMKKQINNQKKRYDSLQQKYNENVNHLTKVNILNDHYQQKILNLESSISLYKQELKQLISKREVEQNDKLKKMEMEYEMIQERYLKLNESLSCIIEEKDILEHENSILRQEIDNREKELKTMSSSIIDIPHNLDQFNQFIRRRSISVQYKEEEEVQKLIKLQPEIHVNNRSSKNQQKLRQSIPDQPFITDNLLQKKVIQLQQQLKAQNIKFQTLKQANEQLSTQISSYKQKNLTLSKQINDYQTSSSKNLLSIYKLKLKTIEQELKQSKQDLNKVKEEAHKMKMKHKEEVEGLKVQINNGKTEVSNSKKEVKGLMKELETKEKEYKRMLGESKIRESALENELNGLRGNKDIESHRKTQIEMYKEEISKLERKMIQLQKSIKEMKQQTYSQKQTILKLQEQLKHKTRQIQRITQSLFRQRKQRSLLTAPSLQEIQSQDILNQQQFQQFNSAIHKKLNEKQDEIIRLQREVSDLKEEKSLQVERGRSTVDELEKENKYYVDTIIEMKMRCAQSLMKADQKQYLYLQLKKKLKII